MQNSSYMCTAFLYMCRRLLINIIFNGGHRSEQLNLPHAMVIDYLTFLAIYIASVWPFIVATK